MVTSVFANRKTAVQAGHAMSKDWTAGMLVIMWLLLYWRNSKVIVTAPTGRQVKDIIFKEIATQYGRLREAFPAFRKDWLTSQYLDFGSTCFATGFTTDESKEALGKFTGIHSPNMLIILSEAQAIPPVVYKQIRGLMTSPNSRLLELGNPVVPFGDFYEHCTNPALGYNVIHLPVFESPNIISGREVIPGMASKEWLEEFQRDCGVEFEDDSEYQTRALAMFPQQSALAWIPLSKIRACIQKYRAIKAGSPDKMKVGGLDPAGEGNDETVHSVLEGNCMLKQDCFRKVLTPETVGWARSLIEEEKLEALAIDEGYNPGILHWLNFEKLPVSGVNFGGESPNEKYANFGTYIWGLLREAIMIESIGLLNDPVLVAQLSSRRLERLPNGKVKLESKKKSGQKSPDRGDALALAWFIRLMMIAGGDVGAAMNDSARLNAELERMETTHAVRKAASAADPDVDDVGVFGDGRMEADDLFE